MVDTKTSDLAAASSLTGAELAPVVQGGVTKRTTLAAILALLVDAAPGSLDTLNELAAALGDDSNFAATMTTALAAKAAKAANLSDLGSAATARTNLGLGPAATLALGSALQTLRVNAGGTAVEFASLGDALYEPTTQVYNGITAGLHKARAGAARAQSGAGIYRIAIVGDSTSAGTGATAGVTDWPTQMRALLSIKGYPTGGTGVVKAANLDDATQWTRSGSWTSFGGDSWAVVNNVVGEALTFTSNVAGTILDFYYINGPRGAFTYELDGGGPVTVTPSGGTDVCAKVTLTGLANTTHTIVFKPTTTTYVWIYAAEVRKSAGLIIDNLGTPSAPVRFFLPATSGNAAIKMGPQGVFLPVPDLAIIMMEIVDASTGYALASYTADMQALVTQYKTAGADVILATGMPQQNPTAIANFALYSPALKAMALTNNVALLDIEDRWTSFAVSNPLGLYHGDTIHGTELGYADIARAFLALVGL